MNIIRFTLATVCGWMLTFPALLADESVAAPTLELGTGSTADSFVVWVDDTTPNAVIRYRTDGAVPTVSDPVIAAGNGVSITGNVIFKARAWDGNTPSVLLPSPVTTEVFNISGAVSAGANRTYALRFDGQMVASGENSSGQLSDGSQTGRTTPVKVRNSSTTNDFGIDAVSVAASSGLHMVFAKRDGTVWAVGNNAYGQLGNGGTTNAMYPAQVLKGAGQPLLGAVMVAAGTDSGYALLADGTVWAWGRNSTGELGDGTTTAHSYAAPLRVNGTTFLENIVRIDARANSFFAVDSSGKIWACGLNTAGQLGEGTTSSRIFATKVQASVGNDFSGVIMVSGGDQSTFAVKTDGTVWSWGNNSSGWLADGTTVNRRYPVQVKANASTSFTGVRAVAAGSQNCLILKTDGTVWAVGNGSSGQMGDGATVSRTYPVQVKTGASTFLTNVVDISAAAQHMAALDSTGTVFTWGYGPLGRLGGGAVPTYTMYATAFAGWPRVGLKQSLSLVVKSTSATDPGAFEISATSIDPSITFSRVDFYQGGNFLGSVTSGPWKWTTTGASLTEPFTAIAYGSGTTTAGAGSAAGVVATPIIRLEQGSSVSQFNVRVSDITPGAVIRYTTNGAEPTATDPTVASGGAVVITKNCKFKAKAWDGANPAVLTASAVAEASYNVFPTVAAGPVATFGINAEGRVLSTGIDGMDSRNAPTWNDLLRSAVSVSNGAGGGGYYILAAKRDGTVWAAGSQNGSGQLGIGTLVASATPVQVLKAAGQPLTDVSAVVATSASSSYALAKDGKVWAWGSNAYGQLGDGGVANRSYAQLVKINSTTQLTGIVAISAGQGHLLALDSSGKVWACGYNISGQLGDGSASNKSYAAKVQASAGTDLAGVSALATESTSSLVVKTDGSVWAWGSNSVGQLGDGTTTSRSYPVQVKINASTNFTGAQAVSGGTSHALILKTDGTVWGVGGNGSGQLGDGTSTSRVYPTQVKKNAGTSLTDIISIAAGGIHSVAVDATGTVFTWGLASSGQLGNGAYTSATSTYATAYAQWANIAYTQSQLALQVTSISGNDPGAFLLSVQPFDSGSDIARVDFYQGGVLLGSVTSGPWQWMTAGVSLSQPFSAIAYNSIGLASTTAVGTPIVGTPVMKFEAGTGGDEVSIRVTVSPPDSVIHYTSDGSEPTENDPVIASGAAIGLSGNVVLKTKAWYASSYGTMPPSAVAAVVYNGIGKVAADSNSYAVRFDGRVVGTTSSSNGPTELYAKSVVSFARGSGQTLAALRDGTVVASNAYSQTNTYGQLGNGTTLVTSSPLVLKAPGQPLTGIIAVAANNYSSYALDADGCVWAWGANAHRELGNGTATTQSLYAEPVRRDSTTKLSGIVQISAGDFYLLALDGDGNVWACGNNDLGQLGDGTTTVRPYAVKTQAGSGVDLTNIVSIGTGGLTSMAVKADGSVWAWGGNSAGQLGDGTTTNRSFPVQMMAAASTAFSGGLEVAGSDTHLLILKTDGTLWAIGTNTIGQLGDGTTTNQIYPVQVKTDESHFLTAVVSFAAGNGHSIALNQDGRVFTWGLGSYGQLGNAQSWSPTGSYATMYPQWPGQAWVQTQLNVSAVATSTSDPTAFRLTAASVDPSSDIVRVDFYQGGVLLGSVTNGPWELSVSGASLSEAFSAVAYSSIGQVSTVNTAYGQVAQPTIQWEQETAPGVFNVKVQVATPNAIIRYTTNGTIPTENDPSVPSGSSLSLSGTVVFKAKAWDGNAPAKLSASKVRSLLVNGVGAVAAGKLSTFALRSDGGLLAVGRNNGALGLGASGTTGQFPSIVMSGTEVFRDVVSLEGGAFGNYYHTIAVKRDGSVWAMGDNNYSQTSTGSNVPTRILKAPAVPLDDAVQAAASKNAASSYALSAEGNVWAWGANANGQLGGVVGSYPGLMKINASTLLGGISAIAAGGSHLLALDEEGHVWACGLNNYGQLGMGNTVDQSYAVKVQASVGMDFSGVVGIAATLTESFAVKGDGTVWKWGAYQVYPIQVEAAAGIPLSGVLRVAGGDSHLLILKTDGTLWSMGSNPDGRLGDGSTTNRAFPVQVKKDENTFLTNIVSLAAGAQHSVAMDGTGTVFAWGERSSYGGTGGLVSYYATAYDNWPVLATARLKLDLAIVSASSSDPSALLITANPSDYATKISRIDFYQGSALIGSLTSGPWVLSVTGVAPNVPITAVAYSSSGLQGETTTGLVAPIVTLENGSTPTQRNVRMTSVHPGSVIRYRLDGMEPDENSPAVVSGDVVTISTNVIVKAKVWDGIGSSGVSPSAVTTKIYNLQGRVAIGSYTVYVLRADGRVMTSLWDGVPTLIQETAPSTHLRNVCWLSATRDGQEWTAVKADGSVWSCVDYPGIVTNAKQLFRAQGQPYTDALMTAVIPGYQGGVYVLNADGTVWLNGNQLVKVDPVTPLRGIVSIISGSNRLLALDRQGRVWQRGGANALTYAVLENVGPYVGVAGNSSQIVGLTGMSGDRSVSVGSSHSLILRADGTVQAQGANEEGQLGDGTTVPRSQYVVVKKDATTPLQGIVAIAAGHVCSAAIDQQGVVYSWGRVIGQYPTGMPTWNNPSYRQLEVNLVASLVSGSGSGAVQLKVSSVDPLGEIGRVDFFQGGVLLGSVTSGPWQLVVPGASLSEPFTAIAYGVDGYAGVTASALPPATFEMLAGATPGKANIKVTNGTPNTAIHYTTNGKEPTLSDPVVVTGSSIEVIGNGILKAKVWDLSTSQVAQPSAVTARVYNLSGSVASSLVATYALKGDGRVMAAGSNNTGRLGDGTTVDRLAPVWVRQSAAVDDILRNAVAIQAEGGGNGVFAVKSDGTVWAWGNSSGPTLGCGPGNIDPALPKQVLKAAGQPLTGVTMLACCAGSTLALCADGTVWSWNYAALGLGGGASPSYATLVRTSDNIALTEVVAIATGSLYGFALKADGTVWGMGNNSSGQLALGTQSQLASYPLPVKASAGVNLTDVVSIAGGQGSSMAVKADGSVWIWGVNEYNQWGSNIYDRRAYPVPLKADQNTDFTGARAVVFASAPYIIKNDGTLWTMAAGQTGYPTQVQTGAGQFLADVVSVSYGVASDRNGTVYTWGSGANGRLGNGATSSPTSDYATAYPQWGNLQHASPDVTVTVTPNSSTNPNSVLLTATAKGAAGDIYRIDFYQGTTLLGSVNAGTWELAVTVADLNQPITAVAYGYDGIAGHTVTATISRVFQVPLARLNHDLRLVYGTSQQVEARPGDSVIKAVAGLDGDGRFTVDASSYLELAFTIPPNAGDFRIVDGTTGEASALNAYDLRELAWTPPSFVVNGVPTSAPVYNLSIPASRAGNAFALVNPDKTSLPVSVEREHYAFGLNPTTNDLEYRAVALATALVFPANPVAGFRVVDLSLAEQAAADEIKLVGATWTSIVDPGITQVAKFAVSAANEGQRFTLSTSGGSKQGLVATQVTFASNSYSGMGMVGTVGVGETYRLKRDIDGAESAEFTMGTAGAFQDLTTIFPSVRSKQTMRFHIGGPRREHELKIVQPDGYEAALVIQLGGNTLQSASPAPVYAYDAFDALVDVNQPWTLKDVTTNETLGAVTSILDGWVPWYIARPNGTVAIGINQGRRGHSFQLRQANGTVQAVTLTSDSSGAEIVAGFAQELFTGTNLHRSVLTQYFLTEAQCDINQAFTIVDLTTGEEKAFPAGAVWADLTNWGDERALLSLQITKQRWDHELLLMQSDGSVASIQRGHVQGAWTQVTTGQGTFQARDHFDGGAWFHPGLAWWIYDVTTGEMSDAGATDLKQWGAINPTQDTDGDGMPDLWEIAHGLNPYVKDQDLDADFDGLTNGQEYLIHTNPNDSANPDSLQDSDHDGIDDRYEGEHGLTVDENYDDSLEDLDGDRIPNLFEWKRAMLADVASQPDVVVDPARATLSTTDNIVGTISEATNTAQPYWSIEVKAGTYRESVTLPEMPVVVFGELGAPQGPVRIVGQGGGYTIRASVGTVLDGLIVTSRYGRTGTGIVVSGTSDQSNQWSRFVNCVVQGNNWFDGGGIYNSAGKLALVYCTISGNKATSHGWAIYNESRATVSLFNTIVWGNDGAATEAIYNSPDEPAGVVTIDTASIVQDDGNNLPNPLGGRFVNPSLTPVGWLKWDSVAIGSANPATTVVARDIHGEARDDGAPDVGADEFRDADGDHVPNWIDLPGSTDPDDRDNDGLSNADEYDRGTDPLSDDTDGDGATDGQEINRVKGATNPFNPDSDGDGIPDGWEIDNDLNPLNDDSLEDKNGNRVPNIFEWYRGSSAADFVVDPANAGIDNRVATIAEAVSAAPAYGIVFVKAGVYYETVQLPNGPIVLVGELGATGGPVEIRGKVQNKAALAMRGGSVVDGFVVTHVPGFLGSGIQVDESSGNKNCRIVNCVIRGNTSALGGGGIYNDGGKLAVVHCTIAGNSAGAAGRAIHNRIGSEVHVFNSIIWDNGGAGAQVIFKTLDTTSVISIDTYSIVQGDAAGVSNPYGGRLVNPTLTPAGWLRLGSEAIGTANAATSVGKDIHGELRGTVPDVGADEYIDGDGDGVPDWADREGLNDPDDWDDDGLTNAFEYNLGTNPGSADTDGDGASDGEEVNGENGGTDAFNPDTDGDGIPDGYEINHGFNPRLDDSLEDEDGDRLPNIFKWWHDQLHEEGTPWAPHYIVDPQNADVSDVDNTVATIQEAIDRAPAYGIIKIKGGVYNETLTLSIRPVLLLGEGGTSRGPVQLRGQAGGYAVTMQGPSVIDGMVITHPYGVSGGGVQTYDSDGISKTRRLVNCVIRGNEAINGAGVYNKANLELVHCTITGNKAIGRGGAIYNQSGSKLSVVNSVVWDNAGEPSPVSIYREPGGTPAVQVTVTHSIVEGGSGLGAWTDNPLLTLAGWLRTTSPAIDHSGVTFAKASLVDIHGHPRNDATPDLGAEEYRDTNANGVSDWADFPGSLNANDRDDDGLTNAEELAHGTDPFAADTDGDEAIDGVEVHRLEGESDPLNPDSDGDRIPDGYEIRNGLNPNLDDAFSDQDGDRVPNIFEWKRNLAANVPYDWTPDYLVDPATSSVSDSDSTMETIGDATNVAPPYSIIMIKAGTYDESVILPNHMILLLGEVGADQGPVQIRRRDSGYTVTMNGPAVLDGLVITHVSGAQQGSGVYADAHNKPEKERRLINCIVRGNTDSKAGAIYNRGSNLTLVHSTVTGNKGKINARAIYNDFGSRLAIINSIVWGNTGAAPVAIYNDATNDAPTVVSSIIEGGEYTGWNENPLLSVTGLLRNGSSPAKNHPGTSLLATSQVDILGQRRDSDSVPDLGANEWADNGDQDDDGWLDADELEWFGDLSQSPLTDYDGDGLSNGRELALGSSMFYKDTNGDGIDDRQALALGIDLVNTDIDGDGISNAVELLLGTDPYDDDSDEDGILDGADYFPLDFDLGLPIALPGDTNPPNVIIQSPSGAVPIP